MLLSRSFTHTQLGRPGVVLFLVRARREVWSVLTGRIMMIGDHDAPSLSTQPTDSFVVVASKSTQSRLASPESSGSSTGLSTVLNAAPASQCGAAVVFGARWGV